MALANSTRTTAQINRRTVLTAALSAPAVALAGSLPVVAAAETLVMALFREWEALQVILDGPVRHPDFESLLDRRIAIEGQMLATPAVGASDVIAKVIAYTCHGEGCLPGIKSAPAFWAEARALVA